MKRRLKLFAVLSSAAAIALASACAPQVTPPPQDGTGDGADDGNKEPNHKYALSLSKDDFALIAGDETLGTAQLDARATVDGETAEGAQIIYSVDNPAVAECKGNTLTAVGAGTATLTATWNDATATASVCVQEYASAFEVNSFDEKYVNLYGRTYLDKSGVHFDNPATGIEVSFFGDELAADVTVTGTVYARVFVDGDKEGKFVKLNNEKCAPLASNLKRNVLHTVRILKSSEVNAGGLTLSGLTAEKFVTAREKSPLKIEFIGDSISAGAGNLATGGSITYENTDAASAFACRTGLALNADFSVVALGGICLKAELYPVLGCAMTDMHGWTSWRTREKWNYDADTDIVVLGLGTNDAEYMKQNESYQPQFTQDYFNFLTHLRSIYPQAHIVCVYGMMGRNSLADQGIMSAVQKMRDQKIVYLRDYFTADNRGGTGHPCLSSHIEYAEILTEYLSDLVK